MSSRSLIWLFLFWVLPILSYSQCVDFTINPNACLNEVIQIENLDNDVSSYAWDFCSGDLLETPTAKNVVTLTSSDESRGVDIIYDDPNWHGFITGRTSNNIVRLDFGPDILSIPVETDLGNIDTQLNGPEPIKIIKEGDQWYGFIHNGAGASIVRIDFGTSLSNNSPSATTVLSSIGGVNSNFDLGYTNDSLVMILANIASTITTINFGTSAINIPQVADYFTTSPGVSSTTSMSVIQDCGNWYGVSQNIFGGDLYLLSFGNSIFNIPSAIELGVNVFSPSSPNRVWIEKEAQEFVVYGIMSNGSLYQVKLGNDLSAPTSVVQNLGNLGVLARTYSLTLKKLDSRWTGFTLDRLFKSLYRIDFPNDCFSNNITSLEKTPSNVSYTQSGTYQIGLQELDDNGEILGETFKSITILSSEAPSLQINYDNLCVSSQVSYSVSSNQTLVSYSWDFGDTNTSSEASPTHIYLSEGEYEVTLEVESSNGCHNFTQQTIKIYDPPTPNFDLPVGTLCTNEEYTFTNNTNDNFDGNLTYEWQVDGLAVGTERDLIYQFETGGAKEIKLITSIPGCDIEQVQNMPNVTLGAVPFYSYDINSTCQSDPITFTNQSTGTGITDYAWDFGDTNNSTDIDPTHTYTSPGEYTVSLGVTNASGCVTNYSEDIVIHSLPAAGFEVELGCTNRKTQLTDLTIIDNANIDAWDWDFGDPGSGSDNVSAEENPVHSFSGAGDFNVTLSTTTNFGCENIFEDIITVYESPAADFEIDAGCVGNAFQFADLSIPNTGGSIVSRTWNINGSIYTVPNPIHNFSASGNYLATLTIRSDNNCTTSVTRTVMVNDLPTADFSLNSPCTNTEIILADASIIENDEIVNWQWIIDGQDAGNSSTITYTFDQATTYEVDLQIITTRGCIVSTSKSIDIFALPSADFEPSTVYSASPAEIIFNNLSNNAVAYQWNFGDGSETSSDISPTHTYPDLGSYDITLITQSPAGCFDEVTKQIHVVDPAIDLSIDEINTFDEGKSLLFTVSNHGTIPVGDISATVSLNNELSINEALDLIILPNETSIPKTLSFTLPENGNIDFICITLSTSDGADINEQDNTQCINISDDFKILTPYPSPVSEDGTLTIPLIGAKNDEVTIALMDSKGKQYMSESVQLSQKGLNNIALSMTSLKSGIYFIQVQSPKTIKSFRIFVN